MNLVQSDCLTGRMNGMNESQYGIQFLLFAPKWIDKIDILAQVSC